MKKLFILLPVLLLILSVACEYQNEEALFGNRGIWAEPVVFSTQIEPIIQANCAVSGCHAAGAILPGLTSFEEIKASAAEINIRRKACKCLRQVQEKALHRKK